MATTFRIDGKHHVVRPDDVILFDSEGELRLNSGKVIELNPRDTVTMLCSSLAPGECVVITSNKFPETVFYRPHHSDLTTDVLAGVRTRVPG